MTTRPSSKRELFVVTLYRMLTEAESDNHQASSPFHQICSFLPHGRAFRIHQRDKFEEKILRHYFRGQKGLTSFQRQLNIYGFKLITQNTVDEGAYFHPYFVRGRPDLLLMIHPRKRVKQGSGTGLAITSTSIY